MDYLLLAAVVIIGATFVVYVGVWIWQNTLELLGLVQDVERRR